MTENHPNEAVQHSGRLLKRAVSALLMAQFLVGCSYGEIRRLGADAIVDREQDIVLVDLPTALDPSGYRFENAQNPPSGTEELSADEAQIEVERAFYAFYDGRYSISAAVRRNRVQQRLVAASDHQCSAYRESLRRIQADSNFLLDVASIGLASAAAVVTGGSSTSGLAAGAAFTSGTRAAANDAFLRQLTLETVSRAIEVRRERFWQQIEDRRSHPIEAYGVEFAVRDAMQYHSLCNLVTGLEQASDAVTMSQDPGLRHTLLILNEAGVESPIVLDPSAAAASQAGPMSGPPTTGSGSAPPAQPAQ